MINETGIELKPCPFCGSVAVLHKGNFRYDYCYRYSVTCLNKDCRGWHHPDKHDPDNPKEAIKRWNKRLGRALTTTPVKPVEPMNTCKDITF